LPRVLNIGSLSIPALSWWYEKEVKMRKYIFIKKKRCNFAPSLFKHPRDPRCW
jgi:hypothetical protein